MYYEKDIIDGFLHEKRTKLGTMSDVEIITSIEDFKKRFNLYFKFKKLDWIVTTLGDREKLRYYSNLKSHAKK